MQTYVSAIPSMNGEDTPIFSAAPPMARPAGTKQRFDKVFLLVRRVLAALIAIVQFCVKIFVFATIVLWPWESAW